MIEIKFKNIFDLVVIKKYWNQNLKYDKIVSLR